MMGSGASSTKNPKSEVAIAFCAAAGLGLQTAEDLSRSFLSDAGFYVFTAREYMSRVRGGSNSTQIRVSTSPVRAPVDRIDWLFAISPGLRPNITDNIAPDTRILGDASVIGEEIKSLGHTLTDLDLARRAKEIGGALYSSMIVAGVIAGIFGLDESCADELVAERFDRKDVIEKNKEAFRVGHALGMEQTGGKPALDLAAVSKKDEIFLSGNDAVALGAAAAGCNFMTAYPMSPGTGVFSYFAHHAEELDCVVEQVEDEIAAINMAIGAGYTGARAMTSTSGGGFALMSEGYSLAGVAETPVVIHIAQRPGPATGLATRTEQADLELALHSGHGEFPRAIYAPINIESAFRVAARAFYTARKFQMPVVLLTDQYFVDSAYDIATPDTTQIPELPKPVRADANYLRYAYAKPGEATSPFSVPGFGDGLVAFDSHEHTENGHITEDRDTRKKMVDKRLLKQGALQAEALPPVVIGPKNFHTAVVCWGSTFESVREAMEQLTCDGVALIACEQVYPLSEELVAVLNSCAQKIFVEGNATGQFAHLVRSLTGTDVSATVLKYDSFQFSADELVRRLGGIIGEICKE